MPSAMTTPPEYYPITGLCVVADPDRCPVGYECILVSKDKKEDCDLWKDSFFKVRVTRYVCFTRVFPLDGGKTNNVLVDIALNTEKDPVPPGFSLVDLTLDTREKATRKKQLCVKLLPRHATRDAISDFIILSRSKRAPAEYTLAGEMNGLAICYKMSPVPPETQSTTVAHPSPVTAPTPTVPQPASLRPVPTPRGVPAHQPKPTLIRQESLGPIHQPMAGVPFKLHPRYGDLDSANTFDVQQIHFRSLVDIESEFSYAFTAERSWSLNSKYEGTSLDYENLKSVDSLDHANLTGSSLDYDNIWARQPPIDTPDGLAVSTGNLNISPPGETAEVFSQVDISGETAVYSQVHKVKDTTDDEPFGYDNNFSIREMNIQRQSCDTE